MPRFENRSWDLPSSPKGCIETWQEVEIAVLMDIRDELQTLNRLLNCPHFIGIPHLLSRRVVYGPQGLNPHFQIRVAEGFTKCRIKWH